MALEYPADFKSGERTMKPMLQLGEKLAAQAGLKANSDSSHKMKSTPPFWYWLEARIFGTSAASHASPMAMRSVPGQLLVRMPLSPCMSWQRLGVMKL